VYAMGVELRLSGCRCREIFCARSWCILLNSPAMSRWMQENYEGLKSADNIGERPPI
jgi:hypothetical protein